MGLMCNVATPEVKRAKAAMKSAEKTSHPPLSPEVPTLFRRSANAVSESATKPRAEAAAGVRDDSGWLVEFYPPRLNSKLQRRGDAESKFVNQAHEQNHLAARVHDSEQERAIHNQLKRLRGDSFQFLRHLVQAR